MSAFRDMALDAGYRGDEVAHVSAMLEQEAMAEAEREAAYNAELEAAHHAELERSMWRDVWLAMPVHDQERSRG